MLANCCAAYAVQQADSVCVHFKLSNATVDTIAPDNRQALSGFSDRLQRIKTDAPASQIKSIVVYGTASPEGSRSFNQTLSRHRAESLARWISSHSGYADSLIQIVPLGADWDALRRYVVKDPDVPHRQNVLDVIDRITGGNRDVSIRRRLKPSSYSYLNRHIFPALRSARADVTFLQQIIPSLPDSAAAPTDTIAVETTEHDATMAETPVHGDTVSALTAQPARRTIPPFALTTNMLYDIAAVPNIGIEIPIGNRFVAAADWMYARWNHRAAHKYWRIYGGDITLLYRVGRIPAHAGRLAGHHIGVYASLACYDFQWGTAHPGVLSDTYNYAAGVCYSYSLPVAPRLNIEFSIGVGYLWGRYKKHTPMDDHDVWLSTHKLGWVGPTRAGISLVWMLGGKDSDKNRKGGNGL